MSSRQGKRGLRTRRKHAVGVCSRCRRRHIKCDMARPICGGCKKIGSACESLDTDLIWQSITSPTHKREKSQGSTPLAPRRHLYTDQDRVSMTVDLQSSLQERSVDESLQEIDGGLEGSSLQPGESNFIGPFGILSLQNPKAPSRNQDVADSLAIVDNANAIELDDLPTEWIDLPSHLQNVEEFLNWPDLFDIDLSWSDLSFDDIILASPTELLPEVDVTTAPEKHNESEIQPAPSRTLNDVHCADFTLGNVQVSEAQMLLRRYKDIVSAHSFSFPLCGSSPWESLNIDTGVTTMGRISFMGIDCVSHAAMSNLLALIAVSAAHKAAEIRNKGAPGAEHWEKISTESYTRGKDYLQQSLKNETHASPPPKYKEQMMAISAMLSYAILLDHQEEARVYLIDSERLLRIRGLTKQKFSRKARQLHHIYTWNRILGESTYVFRVHDKEYHGKKRSGGSFLHKRPIQQGSDETSSSYSSFPSNPNIQLDDFLGSDRGPNDGKENGEVLNAMHIEELTEGSNPFYRQLYGVSETWLSLVSQTTRLANTIDKLKVKSPQERQLPLSIENTKLQLEEMIWKLISHDEPPQPFSESNNRDSSGHPRDYMVHALNLGLLIFFYRRIRESNPRLLQPYVSSIIQALKDFKASCNGLQLEGPGSPWPAFMAGCEAISPHDRDYLSNWMDEAFLVTGFPRFKTIKQCMEKVWMKQQESSDRRATTYPSWVDTCREHKIYVLLS